MASFFHSIFSHSWPQKCFSLLALPLLLLVSPAAFASMPVNSGSQEIVTDRISGIAIMGYDPVAYFTNGEAVQGSPRFEAYWGGVIWRFASAANKAVFEGSAQVYAPAHGGFDPTGIARGHQIPGNPYIFAIQDHQVYLFVTAANRERFIAEKKHARLREAEAERTVARIHNISLNFNAVPAQ